MKTLPPILNREFRLPDDGKVHLVPKGNYPVVHDDKRIVQVVDDQALAAILNNLTTDASAPDFGGLCIDFDHARHDEDKESRAGGWLDSGVEKRATGLFGAPRWTSSGREAVEGGDYRFISPEFDPHSLVPLGGDKFRVTRLVGFGLTNNPNMRGMKPLSNRSGGAPAGTNPSDADHQQTSPNMKKVTSLLGLADGADENQIAGAVEALQTTAGKVSVLTNRVSELSGINETLLGESIDADIAARGITDAATIAKLKPVLGNIKNRQERVDFIALFPKAGGPAAAAKAPLTNRATAHTPAGSATADPDDAKAADVKRANVIANRARDLRKGHPKISLNAAYLMAANQVDSETAAIS